MTQKFSQDKLSSLQYMKDWSMEIIVYSINKHKDQILYDFQDLINETFNRQDVRGMRHLYHDVNEMSKGLIASEYEELNKILLDKFGQNLVNDQKIESKSLKRILKSEVISSEDEYRLVLNHIDDIYMEENRFEEVAELNSLLKDFEQEHRAR